MRASKETEEPDVFIILVQNIQLRGIRVKKEIKLSLSVVMSNLDEHVALHALWAACIR